MSDSVKRGPLGEGTQTDRMIRDESYTQQEWGGVGAEQSDQQSAEIWT